MKEEKRRHGDRRDGALLRDLDAMHFIMPVIYPNRCDNEAFISERIDMRPLSQWLEKKNAENPDFHYTMFHVIVAAILKTILLRPKMNRFIANRNLYQRNRLSAAFVVKKQFADDGAEALAFVYAEPNDTVESIHEKIRQQVQSCRSEKLDPSSESMNIVSSLPRWLGHGIARFAVWLDRHGWCPNAFIASDPYYASVVLSNLGSIGLKSGYHHLTNWGTNSIFCAVGERKMRPYCCEDGTTEMRESVELGLTIDERIADGYYYSGTVRLLKKLLEEPELLEKPFSEEVSY